MDYKKRFFEILKHEFSPLLRELGFNGSGQDFRRVYSPVIHVINIQRNKHGGSCCVNLGVHLEFLPITGSNNILPDVRNIKEFDCEFRKRLAPKKRRDHWWKYDGGLFGNTGKSARNLIETYKNYGEPALQKLKTLEDLKVMLEAGDLRKNKIHSSFGEIIPVRAALTLARIYKHEGQIEKSVEYAKIGLQNSGKAPALKPELERLAKTNESRN
jgi:hypothetical protein